MVALYPKRIIMGRATHKRRKKFGFCRIENVADSARHY